MKGIDLLMRLVVGEGVGFVDGADGGSIHEPSETILFPIELRGVNKLAQSQADVLLAHGGIAR